MKPDLFFKYRLQAVESQANAFAAVNCIDVRRVLYIIHPKMPLTPAELTDEAMSPM